MRNASREPCAGFIIDKYSPFHRNENVVRKFKLHGMDYCIRAIDNFEWGQPIFPEQSVEDSFELYQVYENADAAWQYIKSLKGDMYV